MYIDITVHVHVCAFLYKMYILSVQKDHRSAYTLGRKCIHFGPKVYVFLKSAYTSGRECMHFWPEVYVFFKSVCTYGQKCMSF